MSVCVCVWKRSASNETVAFSFCFEQLTVMGCSMVGSIKAHLGANRVACSVTNLGVSETQGGGVRERVLAPCWLGRVVAVVLTLHLSFLALRALSSNGSAICAATKREVERG